MIAHNVAEWSIANSAQPLLVVLSQELRRADEDSEGNFALKEAAHGLLRHTSTAKLRVTIAYADLP